MRLFLTAAGLAACTTSTSVDPTAIVSGIYTLDATSQLDGCNPPRFAGSFTVPIVIGSNALEISDVSTFGPTPMAVVDSLTTASGYTQHLPAPGDPSDPCGAGGGDTYSIDMALVATGAGSFEVTDDERWTIISPSSCSGNGTGADIVPFGSCTANRTLRYTLVQPCATPVCTYNPDQVCTCPGAQE